MTQKNSKQSIDSLLAKSKVERKLSSQDIASVVAFLDSKDEFEQATAIFILGYVGEKKSIPNLITLLKSTDDALVAGEIVYVISRHFKQPLILRSFILDFFSGTNVDLLDITGELHRKCLLVAGDILAESPLDSELIFETIKKFEDESLGSSVQDEAY